MITASRLSPMTPETLRLRQSTRTTDYIQSFTGMALWPLEPEIADLRIEDIAHSLSLICRFNGHIKEFYSVAQHSVHVSEILPPEYQAWGLAHDFSEALIFDCPKPLKRSADFGELYMKYEADLMVAICQRLNLQWPEPAIVKEADRVLLLTEQRDLLGPQIIPWVESSANPLERHITPWSPVVAEAKLLARFRELFPSYEDNYECQRMTQERNA